MVDTCINKTGCPNGLLDSNHKNVTTQRFGRKVARKEPVERDCKR